MIGLDTLFLYFCSDKAQTSAWCIVNALPVDLPFQLKTVQYHRLNYRTTELHLSLLYLKLVRLKQWGIYGNKKLPPSLNHLKLILVILRCLNFLKKFYNSTREKMNWLRKIILV